MASSLSPARRTFFARLALAFFTFALVLFANGCSKPEPPRLTPKEVRFVAIGTTGLEVVVKVEAFNPNSVPLAAQRVTGKAKLDNKWEMGTVTIDQPFSLAPNGPTTLDIPMRIPWSDISALRALGSATGPVPYVIDGKVTIGGERLNVDIPYAVSGTISREQITNALLKAIPSALQLPGLPPLGQ